MADISEIPGTWGGRRPASLRSVAVVAALVAGMAGGLCGAAAPALAAAGPGARGAQVWGEQVWGAQVWGEQVWGAQVWGEQVWGPQVPGRHPAHGIGGLRARLVHDGTGTGAERQGVLPPSHGRLVAAEPHHDWQHRHSWQTWHHVRVPGGPSAASGPASPRRSSAGRSNRRPHHSSGHRFGWWHPASHRHHGTSSHAGHGPASHPVAKPVGSATTRTHAPVGASARTLGPVPARPAKPLIHAAPPRKAASSRAAAHARIASASTVPAHADSRPPASHALPNPPDTAAKTSARTSVKASAKTSARIPAKTMKPIPVSANGPRATAAVKAAYAALGTPYRWGGTGPKGYDCSGLTQHVWHEAGVSIPRTSSQQAEHGKAVSLSSISPGDLVIFYRGASHVGIYVGGGMVIHSPHTGAVVRLEKMKDMPIYDIRRYS